MEKLVINKIIDKVCDYEYNITPVTLVPIQIVTVLVGKLFVVAAMLVAIVLE